MQTKRRLLALAVTGALGLAACGGAADQAADNDKRVAVDEDSGDGGVVIEDALAQAAVSTADAGSAHMDMTMHMTLPQVGDVTIDVQGVSDFATGDSQITMDMGALFDQLGASALPGADKSFVVEMRVVDGTMYMHFPDFMAQFMGGKPWVSLSGADAVEGGASGLGPIGQADPKQYLEYLAAVSSGVENVGTEKVGDIDTTKYHAVIEFGKALDQVPESTLDTLGLDEDDLSQRLSALSQTVGAEMPVDVWIDGDGLLRKMHMDMEMTGMQMSIDMSLHDYGVDVAVDAPPADQVGDMGAMLGDLGSGFGFDGSAA
jgi:hypothetical protein